MNFPFTMNACAGKLNRGLSVVDSYKLLKGGHELTPDELYHACVLGWCIEWVTKSNLFFRTKFFLEFFFYLFSVL
jgi:Polyprenyl synthetase